MCALCVRVYRMNLYRATQQLAAGARGDEDEGKGASDSFHFPNDEFEQWRQQKRASGVSIGKKERDNVYVCKREREE